MSELRSIAGTRACETHHRGIPAQFLKSHAVACQFSGCNRPDGTPFFTRLLTASRRAAFSLCLVDPGPPRLPLRVTSYHSAVKMYMT